LAGRLTGPAQPTLTEAAAAEQTLRELGERTAAVERGLRLTPNDAALAQAHSDLVVRFTQGVDAYERLVGAAAAYVAEDGRVITDPGTVGRLSEATALLHGIADGLAELRAVGTPPPPPPGFPPPSPPGSPQGPPRPRYP
jgi:hypothetical protein